MLNPAAARDSVLILTPVKNASRHLALYFELLRQLNYPPQLLSLGLLESDSTDDTFELAAREMVPLQFVLRSVQLWKRDFGFHLPAEAPHYEPSIQLERGSVPARSLVYGRETVTLNPLQAPPSAGRSR